MTTFERIKDLAKKRGKNLKTVATELGFSENAFYKWKNQSPSTENLTKVADYFGVSLDYLIGRTDSVASTKETTTTDLDEILDGMMSFDGKPMTENDREAIRAYLQGRLSNK